MHVALVNTNRIRPPIAPIGIDYVAEALSSAGHQVKILDLCWAEDGESAMRDFFGRTSVDLVGVTLRNTDDCAFASRESFLEPFSSIVKAIGDFTDAPVVVGGVGFSVMPEQVLKRCGAYLGLWGEGEFGLVQLAENMEGKRLRKDVANLIWRHKDTWRHNHLSRPPLEALPPMSRIWVDNRRYFREGGQAGIETKRGCPGDCIYCADPLAKGKRTRTRPPMAVVDEVERLLDQGIDHVHTCDSEFNLPKEHASAVCEEMIRRRLGERCRWYAYCTPLGFSAKLADLMARAGCAGINFGVDSGDEHMLRRLRRGYPPEAILNAARACQGAGIVVMFDLLLGAPGETRDSLVTTIELMNKAAPERVGVAIGVRVYPGTQLAELVMREGLKEGLVGKGDGTEPLFFMEPKIAPVVSELLDRLIGEDERFFYMDPLRPDRNYNYSANQRLQDAIKEGYRGAYWDILRRCG
ncbi:MAG: B12-binding domain-containing radical SAM protein [Thermodesulfobacteriota bacterium]|nr:B12-binding domain-containing radical SAM protein [Thermodesulfobacteriota bacterium]